MVGQRIYSKRKDTQRNTIYRKNVNTVHRLGNMWSIFLKRYSRSHTSLNISDHCQEARMNIMNIVTWLMSGKFHPDGVFFNEIVTELSTS